MKKEKIQKEVTVGDYKLIEMAKIVKIKQQVTFGSVYELENINLNPFPFLFPLQTRNFVSNFQFKFDSEALFPTSYSN